MISCPCKGIRTCNICVEEKEKIMKNKFKEEKVISINNLLEKKYDKEKKWESKFQKEFPIEENVINFYPQNINNENNSLLTNSFMQKLFEENKIEILNESKRSTYYKNLLKFVENKEINFNQLEIFNGFYIIKKFLNEKEQEFLLDEINKTKWNESQSGRKKQDYGPKINYKKRKVKIEGIKENIKFRKNCEIEEKKNNSFNKFEEFSFPYFSKEKCTFYDFLVNKIKEISFLENFKICEIGNLYYDYKLGGHIEPHIDDAWIWGKRIIGINLISDTVLTFSKLIKNFDEENEINFEIDFPMEKGDLYIMTDLSRYLWKHSIKKENIKNDRIAITIREFEESFIDNI